MMTVSELSRQGRVARHVVRYYSRIGLLSPARHPDNGYKLIQPISVSPWDRNRLDQLTPPYVPFVTL